MFTIKRITAAVDLSDHSLSVLEYAGKIAQSSSAEVTVVNVINNKFVHAVEKVFNDQHPGQFSRNKFIYDETRRRTQNLKDLIRKYVPKGVVARVVIRSGAPSEEIVRVAEDDQADLLVIASKGHSNLPDYIFGTTTEKIFRHSTVPVLRVG